MMFNQLKYKYQPIVDLNNLSIVRQEALLRVSGISDIEGLIRRFEKNGSIIELDLHTLTTVVSIINKKPNAMVPIAVNMSAQSMGNAAFQHEFMSHLAQIEKPSRLSIEITETAPIQDHLIACRFVHRLKQLGCSIGLDDYGDGYSDLEMVENLRLNYFKLSSKLTTQVLISEVAQRAVYEAIRIAGLLCVPIVAEHVDNVAQFVWLRKAGIAYGQGWIFAKAGELITCPDDFTSDLRKRLGADIKSAH